MDVREKYVMQKVNRKEKSICPNCIHHNICIAENNQPCFECNRFMDAHGVTVQEWIPVDDRLPEEKVNCIVHYKHAYCDNDDYWEIGICFYDGEKFQINPAYKVTHWMPLPQPPKGE